MNLRFTICNLRLNQKIKMPPSQSPSKLRARLRELRVFVSSCLILSSTTLAAAPTAPQGFSIQKVSPNETSFPMFATLDDRGRLFVTESSGLDLYKELTDQTRKCRIRLLEDKDHDGIYETQTIFKDNLVVPMGIAHRDGKIYVPDPPDVLVLEDTNNDGIADKQTKILTGFGHTDNGSLHGLTFGPDGLLYMTTGNPDGYKFKLPDGQTLWGESGALLRCNPDGSNPQMICRGFENLVEIAFLPGGQIIGTDNWFQRPSGGHRDALVHLLPGGLYPLHLKDKGTPQFVNQPLPPVTMFPAVALSGLMRYEGYAFPSEYRDNLFSAQHNARCIGRHILKPIRSTFSSEDSQFITSDDPDFHPSDVLEDADGSLLIVDTGGWYVQHCPTGKIRNSRAPGGIYRVRFDTAPKIDDPRGLKIDWEKSTPDDLIQLLSDKRPAVAHRAQLTLISRGSDSVGPLIKFALRDDRRSRAYSLAFAALGQIDSNAARAFLALNLKSATNSIEIQATASALARQRDKGAAEALEYWVPGCGSHARLACAQALAICGRHESIPAILKALTDPNVVPEQFLEHSLLNALYHLGTPDDFRPLLTHENPNVQKAALILLDQPTTHALQPDDLFPRLSSPDPDLRSTAQSLLKNHPDWSDQSLAYFQNTWANNQLSPDSAQALSETLIAFSSNSKITDWLATTLSTTKDPARKLLLLQTLSRMPPPKNFDTWIAPLRDSLSSPDLAIPALTIITSLNTPQFDPDLQKILSNSALPLPLRLQSLRILINRQPSLDDASFTLLLNQFTPTSAPSSHFLAAEIASRAHLTDEQFQQLLEKLNKDRLISPDALLPLFTRSANQKTADPLLAYLKKSIDSGWRPPIEKLEPLRDQLGPKLNPLLDDLRAHAANQQDRLTQLEPLLKDGNPTAGRAIFFGAAVACSTCHRIANEGGQVGPDLTKVGAIRAGRDLLESIVFPSSTLAQGYENYILTLKNNDQLTGLIADKSDTTTTLRDSSGALRILRNSDIKSSRRETTSLMPQGLNEILTPDQFRDLLAFLQSLK
jgi:putative heme-binding domain-containing protein